VFSRGSDVQNVVVDTSTPLPLKIGFNFSTIQTMAQYAIMRFSKQKGGGARGLEAHHERQKEQYASNPDIDPAKSKNNFHIVKPTKYYRLEVNDRITAAGCRTRKDSTRFVDTLITASPAFFKGKKRDEIRLFFETAHDFISQKVGKENIFTAVVHLDEKTPHMHLCFTPITPDKRLSAKDILGNRVQLSKWQDEFHAHMVKKYPDLERGESSRKTGRRHIPTRIFKQAAKLTRQAAQITAELDGINPLNAGKKRDSALALLHKWFPSMENFEGEIKKYKKTINQMAADNTELKEKVKEADSGKFARNMENAKLQSQILELQKFVDTIPPDLYNLLKAEQKQRKQQRGQDI